MGILWVQLYRSSFINTICGRCHQLEERGTKVIGQKNKKAVNNLQVTPSPSRCRKTLCQEIKGRQRLAVEDCVNIEFGSLHKYVGGSSERLLTATKDENIWSRLNSYKDKSLHGQFVRGTEIVRPSHSWYGTGWEKESWRKRLKISPLLHKIRLFGQNKNKIGRRDVSPMCRLCGERKEIVSHVTQGARNKLKTSIKTGNMTRLPKSSTRI